MTRHMRCNAVKCLTVTQWMTHVSIAINVVRENLVKRPNSTIRPTPQVLGAMPLQPEK